MEELVEVVDVVVGSVVDVVEVVDVVVGSVVDVVEVVDVVVGSVVDVVEVVEVVDVVVGVANSIKSFELTTIGAN